MRLPALKPMQYLTLAGVLALTASGGYFAYERFAPRQVTAARVTAVEVGRGTIASSVTATGSVASPTQSKLTFKSGGRLTQLLVGVGDTVQEGQPLARLDDADLQIALQQAQAGYNSAVAKLEQTRAGTRPEEIAAAQAQVEQAQIKLNQLLAVNRGPDAAAAQSQVESARIKLNQVVAGGRAEDLAAGTAQLEAAQAKLNALQNPRPEDLASAESQVEQAQIKLNQLLAVNSGPDAAAAQSQVESARIKLSQLQAGGRAEDVTAGQAQLEAAQAKLAALQNPRPEDLAGAESQLEQARIKLEQLLNPRPEDIRNAEAQLVSARAKLQALVSPRQEDLAAAQAQLDSARTKLAQLRDQPQTATPQDIANGELKVKNAQVSYDKALADSANAGKAGSSLTQAASDAAIKQALIALEQAQNDLSKLQQQGPTEWDVRAQQLAVDQAQASLDKLRNPAPADIVAAQQGVVQAQTSLDKLLSPSEFDVQAAQQSIVQAQASLDKLVVGNRFEVQTARASLTQALANLNLKAAPPMTQDVAVAQAAVDTAGAQLEQAKANLAGAVLTAPYGGAVAAVGAAVGEQVGSGVAVVTLVDTRQVRVDVVVDETDVAKVQPGQTVNLTFEALQGQRIAGTVAVVAPTGTVTQGVVNYSVQIQVDPAQAQGVRPGMTATAQVVTQSKDDVVSVPNRALRTQGRTRTVEVLEADGKTSTRQVQTGLANDQMTEVLGGLQPGDRVVIPATTTAAANARVPGLGAAVPAGPGGPGGPGGPVVVQRPAGGGG